MAAIVLLIPCAARGQQPAPNAGVTRPAGPDPWCFGVKLDTRPDCENFAVLELGVRARASGQTDHSTRDPAHAYPVLDDHGFAVLGYARRISDGAALGVVGEVGAGESRRGLGLRFDQTLGRHARLDFTVGGLQLETHQRGVTRTRLTGGTFADAAIRVNEVLILQARGENFHGDGSLVKPASGAYIGVRVDGGGAVKTTLLALTLLAAMSVVIFFTGGGEGT
jgi:hypothetical protein